jgi:hypothetical protein
MKYLLGPIFLAMLAGFLICCSSPEHSGQNAEAKNKGQSPAKETEGEDLIKFVEVYSGSGADSGEAWSKLNSYPREDLISRLLRISDALPQNDHHRALIAFVLCNLDYHYSDNRKVIVNSFTDAPVYEHPFADWAGSMIDRLIERGDNDLLSNLFHATEWADGALASSLSGYLTKHLKDDPNAFLLRLKLEPKGIRYGVYRQILSDELLTDEDKTRIKVYLESVPSDSPTKRVAKEMSVALSKKDTKHS